MTTTIIHPANLCIAILCFTLGTVLPVSATESRQKKSNSSQLKASEEYQIGVMVKAISAALKAPEHPESLQTIVKYGQDSRYYVMIRGWLMQELRGVESQHQATRNEVDKAKFKPKLSLLQKAIRRIDLE